MAGGVALNVVMTGKVARSGLFEQTYVFPASGDDGAAVGAAQYVYHDVSAPRATADAPVRTMSLGPAFARDQVARALEAHAGKAGVPQARQRRG